MIFNLIKLLAVATIALAATSSPPLEGPVTARECKTYHYQDFCCMFLRLKSLTQAYVLVAGDEIIDNYSPTIDLFGSSSQNIDTLIGFSCRPPSALIPTW